MKDLSRPGRVFIRCDGGRGDGLGHIVRCVNLGGAFRDTGLKPSFLTWSPDGIGRTIIEAAGFDFDESPAPAGSRDDLAFVLEHVGRDTCLPLLVLDSRGIDSWFVKACSGAAFVACLDDDLMRDLPCDAMINNNAWATESDYEHDANRELLLGPIYNLVRSEFFRARDRRTTSSRPHVLVTMGGEDPCDQTSRFIELLGESLVSCSVTVIVGPAHPDADAIFAAARRFAPHADVMVSPSDLPDRFAVADLAITAGGTTCYELAAAGVSQAAVILDDHQEKLVRVLAEAGCLVPLGHYNTLEVDRVRRDIVRLIASASERERLASAGRRLIPAPGAPRRVEKLAKQWAHRRENTLLNANKKI